MKILKNINTDVGNAPCGYLWFLTICIISLTACQTPQKYLASTTENYKSADFVEDHVLVIQTCLKDKKINIQTLDMKLPTNETPLTVCQERQLRGLPCPRDWEANDPSDFPTAVFLHKFPVWVASGSQQDIDKFWIPTGDVNRSPYVNSAGAGHDYLKTKSTENQPIFESYKHDVKSLFARSVTLNVFRENVTKNITFWFQPPKNITINKFTAWHSADFEELDFRKTSYGISMALNGKFPQGEVGSDSPYVRFGLFTYRNYEDSKRWYKHVSKYTQIKATKIYDSEINKVQALYFGDDEVPPC